MSDICIFHDQAMHIMNDAFSLKKDGKRDEAKEKFLQACELEAKSAFLVDKLPENEPSRSMLFLGAASLAWHGENFSLAERLIGEGLSGYPPNNVRHDLFKLLDDIKFSIAAQQESQILREAEVEIRLYGEGVGHGRIKSQSLIHRVDAIDKIISRTVQRIHKIGFETRPKKRKEFSEYQVDIEWAKAGSFGMRVCLTHKMNEQLSLLQKEPSEILKDVIDNIELLNEGNAEKLKDSIGDDEYYTHFVAQAKEIFPDGNIVNNVGVITKNKSFPIKLSKNELKNTILKKDNIDNSAETSKIYSFIGYLKVSDGINNKFKIVQDDESQIKITVRDALEELAKKYFGDKIEATCVKKGKTYSLVDITPLSD